MHWRIEVLVVCTQLFSPLFFVPKQQNQLNRYYRIFMDPGGLFFSLLHLIYIVIVFSQDIVLLLYTISPFFKPVFVRVREKGHTLTWESLRHACGYSLKTNFVMLVQMLWQRLFTCTCMNKQSVNSKYNLPKEFSRVEYSCQSPLKILEKANLLTDGSFC